MHAQPDMETEREAVPSGSLNEWLRQGMLLSLILDAGQTIEWPESETRLAASSGYAFRRRALLTVVTYCYATEVYDSKKIALKISQDELLRFLCAGTYPTWKDIRDFTQHNRRLIKQSLIRTCQLALKFGLRIATVAPAEAQREQPEGIDDETPPDLGSPFAAAAESRHRQAGDSVALALEDTD